MQLALRLSIVPLLACSLIGAARADVPCRTVEIAFRPAKELQFAVWIEDAQGNYVGSAYVTRLTGSFGLGNRPGNHFLHSATRFPYGRRDMVLPVWAHKRNQTYRMVVMGGSAGNSMATCATSGYASAGDCDDDTIAFHSGVSSLEPFYCSPSGGMVHNVDGTDIVSCASTFIGSKGAFASTGLSYYPPRADLTSFIDKDSVDARNYVHLNDLGAISGATPQTQTLLDPPIRWRPPADGDYVAKVEVNLEGDFNAANNHVENVDSQHGQSGVDYNSYGKNFLGQPSVVYAVPFHVGPDNDERTTSQYEGYGDWDGATGTEHPADGTISDTPGSGAGRLLDATDGGATFRVRVRTTQECSAFGDGGVGGCLPPSPPTHLSVVPNGTALDVSWASAPDGPPTTRFDVRYRDTPISEKDFFTANPPDSTPPPPGSLGSTVHMTIHGLLSSKSYYVGVRAFSACDAGSNVTSGLAGTGAQKFTVLHGCFIATAAYGTPMAAELDALRAVRDRALLTNPLGRIAVASYYALSPPVARAIASDERLRAGARTLLAPLVALARAGLGAAAQAKTLNDARLLAH